MTREEAIARIKDHIEIHRYHERNAVKIFEALDMAIKALRFDRVHGEWVDVNGDGSLWRCSRCEDTACCNGNYCPTCGAQMKWGYDE